ncbi:hypothetical protein HYN48_11860 [Flavobacterium magnum]|uniref:LPS export ABC transporter periplasmic protein LptC n=1 Tax=Flavobacterium magnum TaxID=2162713 RepID=A0A2S0RJ21_9FLAO|nr:hypothetical protein [Flavobacterium magnum]AWA30722.1 hypothetical protein HYN48_11860 [Flavobacterium magnum]
MKKIALLLVFTLFTVSANAQKKKAPAKKTVAKITTLAKTDNLSADMAGNKFMVSITDGKVKDTLFSRPFDPAKTLPADFKITPFTAKGAKLYAISWTQRNISETKLKNEEALTTFTEIWDAAAKKQILANNQITTKVSEIVYLDKNQTVSETQQKMRREGFELTITPEGDIVLKNKTQENRMTYDAGQQKFINTASPKPAKKK